MYISTDIPMRFNAVSRCKSLEYLCLNVACRRRSRFYMLDTRNSRKSYFSHQHGLVNVSDDVISFCVRGDLNLTHKISSVDGSAGSPLFMTGKGFCWTTVKKQCLTFNFFFFKYIVAFVLFKLFSGYSSYFQWPWWGFLPWTEGHQQFRPRVWSMCARVHLSTVEIKVTNQLWLV